ncbi:MAG: peroxiredoxin family protein [Thermodesulfobacteriota bacterium]
MRLLLLLSLLLMILPNPSPAKAGDPWRELGIQRVENVQAPDFTLRDINGETLSLSDFKGKVVFLNFWATWCPPCKAEMPAMEQLHRKFRERGLAVVAVNQYEEKGRVMRFIEEGGYTFTVPLDREGTASRKYRVSGLPVTFIIDRAGMLIGQAWGMRLWDSESAFRLIEELIGE